MAIEEEFVNLLHTQGRSSEDLIKWVDENCPWPGLAHWNMLQLVWIEDRAYFMGLTNHRSVADEEATEDYNQRFTANFHQFYYEKYIEPAVNNPEKISKLNSGDLSWLEGKRKNIEQMISDGKILPGKWKPAECT